MPVRSTVPSAVVADVDGTIAGADHQVTPRTLEALGEFERRGVPVILASGRSEANVLALARAAGLGTPVLACNGALVTEPRTGERLRVRTVPTNEVTAIVELHHRTGAALTWWTTDRICVTSTALQQELALLGDGDIVLCTAPSEPPSDILKIMLNGTPDELDAIGDQVVAAVSRTTRSLPTFWELSAPDGDKWASLSWLFAQRGIDPTRVLGIGDGGNDVRWLSEIGYPVAMDNAHPDVHDIARGRAGHHAEEGAAGYLEAVLASWPDRWTESFDEELTG